MKWRIMVFVLMSGLLNSAFVAAICNNRVTLSKPDSLYTNNNDGTVTDSKTGLMWQQCSLGLTGNLCSTGSALTLSWQAALAAANGNADYAYDDWRLPNKNELESLAEDACYTPAINETLFPNTPSNAYWSSSPYGGFNSYAWYVNFYHGYVYYKYKSDAKYVRLVRGSQ